MFEATVGVVVERGCEPGSALHGMLANDSGHAYETEESSHTIAAASVAVLVGVAVRTYEGVASAGNAAQQVELVVDVAKESDVEEPSVNGVVVLGVVVLACANDFEAFGQLVLE